MASAKIDFDTSEYMKARLRQADDAIHEYDAQQQIIWILIERLGGSVTISDESMVTRRRGAIRVHRDEIGVTISLGRDEAVAA